VCDNKTNSTLIRKSPTTEGWLMRPLSPDGPWESLMPWHRSLAGSPRGPLVVTLYSYKHRSRCEHPATRSSRCNNIRRQFKYAHRSIVYFLPVPRRFLVTTFGEIERFFGQDDVG
jgi:hypothetical protein